jgi:3-hydroxyacyl-CoA dehydrogenase/3a,7a,12a-trihydroxy-5b-cholest-24-enoyl-CoA hydratase
MSEQDSRILQTVAKNEMMKSLKPEYIAPLVLFLCHEKCTETSGIFEVGAGWIGKLRWQRTRGVAIDPLKELSPEMIEQAWNKIIDFSDVTYPSTTQDSMKPVVMQLMKQGGMKSKL